MIAGMKTKKTLLINFFLLGLVNIIVGIVFIYGSMMLNSSFPVGVSELVTLVSLGMIFGVLELALGVASFMSFYNFMKEQGKKGRK